MGINEGKEIDWNYDNDRFLKDLNEKVKYYDYTFSIKNDTFFSTSKAKYGINFKIDSLGNIKFDSAHLLKDFKPDSILSAKGIGVRDDDYHVYREYDNALEQFFFTLLNIESLIRSKYDLD